MFHTSMLMPLWNWAWYPFLHKFTPHIEHPYTDSFRSPLDTHCTQHLFFQGRRSREWAGMFSDATRFGFIAEDGLFLHPAIS